jgi:hypothetical protein
VWNGAELARSLGIGETTGWTPGSC